MKNERYENSNILLSNALEVTPLGAQTFSKSKTQYPVGVSPFFATKGKGCYLWDVDGNKYIDWSMGLCSTLIGYADPDVNREVKKQLKKGSIFSLSTELETEVSKMIIDLIPCAEMVRFGKNGSDVTTGAIRLARAYTERPYVIKCKANYHGWHSWTIYHVNELGIDQSEHEKVLLAEYNNLDSFQKFFDDYPDQIACVILEPMNVEYPMHGFLYKLKNMCHANGALLIFDEVITGFRFNIGGAQTEFTVIPDLCCLGKGLANGFPLSALVGKREIMQLLEKVHFSFTFGGDCIALAAAKATLNKLYKHKIPSKLYTRGYDLKTKLRQLVNKYDINFITVKGHPTWSHLIFSEAGPYTAYQIKSLFFQEVFKRGIITNGSHNISYSHGYKEIDKTIEVYEEVFPILKKAIIEKSLLGSLDANPIKPLFKVR